MAHHKIFKGLPSDFAWDSAGQKGTWRNAHYGWPISISLKVYDAQYAILIHMPNRLADSNSPYLLQHKDNPVDWYPWGEEALARAKAEDKPIFLSIGYAACHWCHVMAHESFEDRTTAEYMNQHFVNIKVDREERPDIDGIYMEAVVALTGSGGWPMSVFLTPDGQPFLGGTYFPPAPRHNLPAFTQVLEHVNRLWREERDKVVEAGAQLQAHVNQAGSAAVQSQQPELERATLDQAAMTLALSYD